MHKMEEKQRRWKFKILVWAMHEGQPQWRSEEKSDYGQRKKDREDLFSMSHGELGILPEYTNEDN